MKTRIVGKIGFKTDRGAVKCRKKEIMTENSPFSADVSESV